LKNVERVLKSAFHSVDTAISDYLSATDKEQTIVFDICARLADAEVAQNAKVTVSITTKVLSLLSWERRPLTPDMQFGH
jgi:hypothetical protein